MLWNSRISNLPGAVSTAALAVAGISNVFMMFPFLSVEEDSWFFRYYITKSGFFNNEDHRNTGWRPWILDASACSNRSYLRDITFFLFDARILFWRKREYFLVSIQRSSERVFIGRKNMTFFLGIIGQSIYEIKTEPVRKKIYDQAIWRLTELGVGPDYGKKRSY